MLRVTEAAHTILKNRVTDNDVCIDMTCGNGNDTVFLCNISKFVYGFDIQDVAINNTKNKLIDFHLSNYRLIHDTHDNVLNYVKEPIKAAIFNLGYLPKGDKSICTNYLSTIKAIKALFTLLEKGGLIALVVYPGHNEGKLESYHLETYLSNINQKEYSIMKYSFLNQINNPPYLIAIEKLE